MKKINLMWLVLFMTIILSSCSNTIDVENKIKIEEVKESINLLDTKITFDKFSFQLVNYKIVVSENDIVKDTINIYEEVQDSLVDSTQLGFDIGFMNSNDEVLKRNSYLILTLEYSLNDEDGTQRDSVIPKVNINAKDNVGDDLLLLHDSMKEKYIQIDNPRGVMVFKTYTDSKRIEFEIDGNNYYLEIK